MVPCFHFLSFHFISLHFYYFPILFQLHLLGIDQATASRADLLIPLSSNTEVSKYLVKINDKLKQLKTIGLTRGDHNNLENRLSFVWGKPEANPHTDNQAKLKIW
jgi:hypothetical protein